MCLAADLGLYFRPLRCRQLLQASWASGCVFTWVADVPDWPTQGPSRIPHCACGAVNAQRTELLSAWTSSLLPTLEGQRWCLKWLSSLLGNPSPFPPCVVSVVYYCWLKGTRLNICQTPVLSPECASKQTGRKQHHPC